jgi:hypothetical protein
MNNDTDNDIIICPHCNMLIHIQQLNCKIFRHGVYKHNNEQINPHASKIECDSLVVNNQIYGCGKPFLVELDQNGKMYSIICDYI